MHLACSISSFVLDELRDRYCFDGGSPISYILVGCSFSKYTGWQCMVLVQLHGEMCKCLCTMYVKVLSIFPDLEGARPRSTSGIQALCALHIALEKTKNVLQHCAECSKLYLVRVLLVFYLYFLHRYWILTPMAKVAVSSW